MAYSTQADIELKFGAANVARWSSVDPANPTTVNTSRIAEAIAQADGYINSRLRGGRYAVPVGGADATIVKDWSVKLAAAWMYDPHVQPDTEDFIDPDARRFTQFRREVDKALAAVRNGRRLDLTAGGTHPTVPVAVTDAVAAQWGA